MIVRVILAVSEYPDEIPMYENAHLEVIKYPLEDETFDPDKNKYVQVRAENDDELEAYANAKYGEGNWTVWELEV